MNPRINQLVKSLLQKDSLEQCSLPELQQYADRHPFFGAAQLLLTKKMQQENPEQYNEQLQKTFLFFHNPMWVEHMLNDTGNAVISQAKKEPVQQPITEIIPPVAEQSLQEEITNPTDATNTIETIPAIAEKTNAEVNIPMQETANSLAEEIKPEPVQAITPDITPAPSVPVEAEVMNPENISAATPVIPEKEPELATPTALALAEPLTGNTNELIFEPYHTVDYFASQGIKFKEEEKPTDKFGKQLKSFTEWLKVMKRLPVAEITSNTAPAMEEKVDQLAEHSLKEGEVLTETMAEVWEKQGNREKAIEIYRKLSLLEPAKSTYFAAKIEELKKEN